VIDRPFSGSIGGQKLRDVQRSSLDFAYSFIEANRSPLQMLIRAPSTRHEVRNCDGYGLT